jgi:tetratricopeptide (TPR) repeat protein
MARRLSAYSEAITQYSHALDIANQIGASPGQLSFLSTRRGRMYELAGRYDEALANYHTMQEQALKLDEPRLELSALNAQATIYAIPSGKWDPPRAEELAKAALVLAERLNDPRGEARAEWNLMLVENFSERDPESAVRHGERSLAIARQHGLTEEEAYATHDLARAYNMSGQYGKAAEALVQARRLWEQLGNSELLADNLTSSAFSSLLQGNLAQAIESAQRALEISRKTGNTWGQAYSLMCLGLAHIESGEISDGKHALEESAVKAREANFSAAGSFVHSFLGLTYYRLGNPQRALELIEVASQAATEQDPTRLYPIGMKALILASQGETAEAHRVVGEFSAQMEGQSTNPEFLGFSSFLQSELLLADHQFDEVMTFVDRRIAQLESFGARYFVPQLTLSRAVALRKLGRLDEASAALDQARRAAREMGLRLTLLSTFLETIELAEQTGDAERIVAVRQEAKVEIEFISSHVEDEALRASFRNQTQIQSILAA